MSSMQNMSSIQYQFLEEYLTPRLLQAIGLIVVRWVEIEVEIDMICQSIINLGNMSVNVPKKFDEKAEFIKNNTISLYNNHYRENQREVEIFKNYYSDLKSTNSLRDDICHGVPSVKIGKNNKKIECIFVYTSNRGPRSKIITFNKMEKIPHEMAILAGKTRVVSAWIRESFVAASDNHFSYVHRNGWNKISKENRRTLDELLF